MNRKKKKLSKSLYFVRNCDLTLVLYSFSTAIEGIVTLLDSSSKVKNEVDAVAEIHTDKPVDASHFEVNNATGRRVGFDTLKPVAFCYWLAFINDKT